MNAPMRPQLRPYQDEGATFIYEHDRTLILSPVGSGKTALALTAISEMLRDGVIRRVLVLAPKRVAQHVWPAECAIWTPHLCLVVAVGAPTERLAAFKSGAQIVVLNYDNIQWATKWILLEDFDAVVMDELTRLKNASGARFKALAPAIEHIQIRIGLTGSFTSNGLLDTFGQCKIVDQSLLGRSKGAFLQQYFVLINPDYGDWSPRVGSLEKVMARIKPATFLLEPGDYKDKLPPLHIVELRCDLADRKPYEQMKTKFKADFPDAQTVAANSGVVTGKLQQMASGWCFDTVTRPDPERPGKWIVNRTPHWYDTAKFDLLDELLSENQHAPTLVWYWYTETLAELKRRYPQAQTLDDKDAVARWNRGEIELLLAHPQSAGHGLNLQGQNKMAFLELPWSLELYEQAIGRLHRSGQKRDVWTYVLLTNKTVDEQIWAALHDKRAISDIAQECLR